MTVVFIVLVIIELLLFGVLVALAIEVIRHHPSDETGPEASLQSRRGGWERSIEQAPEVANAGVEQNWEAFYTYGIEEGT